MGVASVTPPTLLGPPSTGGIFGSLPLDLVLHFAGYAILAGLLIRARVSIAIAILVATAVGCGIEGVQLYLPFRTGSLVDAFANAAGALVGALLAHVARRHRSSNTEPGG